jgi:HAE1 family hydrophobic/amphiphilic exporter-1
MIAAAKIRLRPVLMLSFCFIAGLIPMALNIEEGGDMLQPMAVGAIGGLVVGVMVTLFLLPSLYLIFTRKSTQGASIEAVEEEG